MKTNFFKIFKTFKEVQLNEASLEEEKQRLSSLNALNYLLPDLITNAINENAKKETNKLFSFSLLDIFLKPVPQKTNEETKNNSSLYWQPLNIEYIEDSTHGIICVLKNSEGEIIFHYALNDIVVTCNPNLCFSDIQEGIGYIRLFISNRIEKLERIIAGLRLLIQNSIYGLNIHKTKIRLLLKRYCGRSSCEENNVSILNTISINIRQFYFLNQKFLHNEQTHKITFNRVA